MVVQFYHLNYTNICIFCYRYICPTCGQIQRILDAKFEILRPCPCRLVVTHSWTVEQTRVRNLVLSKNSKKCLTNIGLTSRPHQHETILYLSDFADTKQINDRIR